MIDEYFKFLEQNPQHTLYIISIVNETISDGIGLRMSLYFSGCNHQCQGCHNQESWDQQYGKPITKKDMHFIIESFKNNPLLDGITLTGGDPFYNIDAMLAFVEVLSHALVSPSIWAYTGYTFETLLNSKKATTLLSLIDVLVDGPFILEKFDPKLKFKGSKNQRIIDVSKSLTNQKVITLI